MPWWFWMLIIILASVISLFIGYFAAMFSIRRTFRNL